MEKLKAEAARKRLNVEKEQLKLKVDLLRQRTQLLKEGVPQDEIDSTLTLVHDYSNN